MPIGESTGNTNEAVEEKKFGEGQIVLEAFNVTSQKDEPHIVTIDKNGEYVFTAEDGSFFKLPGDLDKDGVTEALVKYKESNKGQVSAVEIEKQEEENKKKLQSLIQ